MKSCGNSKPEGMANAKTLSMAGWGQKASKADAQWGWGRREKLA